MMMLFVYNLVLLVTVIFVPLLFFVIFIKGVGETNKQTNKQFTESIFLISIPADGPLRPKHVACLKIKKEL
jgi:hypothetical protein